MRETSNQTLPPLQTHRLHPVSATSGPNAAIGQSSQPRFAWLAAKQNVEAAQSKPS